jgi:HEAT repeat protein
MALALLALPSHPVAALETASRPLRVEFRHGLLSLEAQQAPWPKLLEALSRQTAIHLRVNGPLDGFVTASFKGLPIEQALRHLFGPDANFILLYDGPHSTRASLGRLAEVWVFGTVKLEASETLAARGRDSGPAASGRDDGSTSGQEMEKWFARNPKAARDAALGFRDPEVRLLAIAHLGRQADRMAVDALLEIVRDRDPHMRQSAVDALGPLRDSDPHVRGALGALMSTAEDPDIRQLAADSLGTPLAASR